jgi:hypothetical protein
VESSKNTDIMLNNPDDELNFEEESKRIDYPEMSPREKQEVHIFLHKINIQGV